MIVFQDLPDPPLAGHSALTIGNFDGIHRGHQALLQLLLAEAHKRGWLAGLITFDPHPVAVLRPDADQRSLTTIRERLHILEEIGLDFVVVYPFSAATARTPARRFVEQVHRALGMSALWVGPDFVLGRNREGNVAALQGMAEEFGFQLNVIKPQILAGSEVRSGRIRDHLLAGEVNQAAHKLGRLYTVTGAVVEGARRGRAIGFPTANIAVPADRLVPANGVYATWVDVEEPDQACNPAFVALDGSQNAPAAGARRYAGVTNVGVRPSFDNGQRTVETHLLDFEGDLYGRRLTLHFVSRLRPEKRFDSIDALVAQIAQDAVEARARLATGPRKDHE